MSSILTQTIPITLRELLAMSPSAYFQFLQQTEKKMSKTLNVIDQRPALQPVIKLANQIPVGTVFTGSIGGNKGAFLRAYDSVIHFDNPRATWGIFATVENYQPVNAHIVITGNAAD